METTHEHKAPEVADGGFLIGSFRTKSGTKYHRVTCRFAKTATPITESTPETRKLAACAVCKPHLTAAMLPAKTVGADAYGACQICCKGLKETMTKDSIVGTGYVLTKTGVKFHSPKCRLVGGPGVVKAPKVVAVEATKVATDGAVTVIPPKGMTRKERKAARLAAKANQTTAFLSTPAVHEGAFAIA